MALSLFEQYLQAYADWRGATGISEQTINRQGYLLRQFIRWCEDRGLHDPQAITLNIIERYQRHLYHYRRENGQALSLGAQRNRLTPLKGFFAWLVRERYIAFNPASELQLPRPHKRLPKAILTESEIGAVLDAALDGVYGLRDRAIIETLYATGIRRNELAHLKCDDIDLQQGTLMVREGKGKKDRLLPIGQRACGWIGRYVEALRPELVTGTDPGWLFLTEYGEVMIDKRLSERVKRLLQKAGIDKPGACHLFRHAMATRMLENGADIRFIQAMLGHADISTTQVYTQVAISQLKAVYGRTHPTA